MPLIFAELAFASWETIARRTWMMAQGRCTPAEYQRMLFEKVLAAHHSSRAISRGAAATMAPWRKRAAANARRLRRK